MSGGAREVVNQMHDADRKLRREKVCPDLALGLSVIHVTFS